MDDAHGALLHAQLAAHALVLVDVGQVVLHGDGLLGRVCSSILFAKENLENII